MLIGIAGYAQSGKDTVCNILRHHGVVSKRYAFADPIKVTCNALFGWDDRHAYGELKETQLKVSMHDLDVPKFTERLSEYGIDQFGLDFEQILGELLEHLTLKVDNGEILIDTSPREVYQVFGTEVGRNKLDSDIWVKVCPLEDVCIPDVRFPNEVDYLQQNGGILIRVVKNDATPVRVHESESYIADLRVHHVVENNGSLSDLESSIIKLFGIPSTSPRLYMHTSLAYNDEDVMRSRLTDLDDVIDTQGQPGNWDQSPYMHGMYNGLVLARSIMKGESDVQYRNQPEVWGCDKALESSLTTS